MKLFFLGLLIFIFSCNSANKREVISIQKNDTIMKGDIINGVFFKDTILYYNMSNNLIGSAVFENNKYNGFLTSYYPTGTLQKTTNYSNGVKNGFNNYFDSLGNCFYKDFYYFDLLVGPIIYFSKQGEPKIYYFSNLQNETLVKIDYQNWGGIKDIYSKCINFTSNTNKEDSVKKISLLLYLINPPKFSFEYSVFKKKVNSEEDFILVEKISDTLPFIQFTLPSLPKDETYSIGVDIYDSLLRKETIIYKDL